ncbi:hypothetical protein DFH11DRAFT_1630184 [Phellopilus nigrolimitatus]|nr:hypothetical protein DFH11DRAFT_1630184 [Phellopilus nigrolimitatus]
MGSVLIILLQAIPFTVEQITCSGKGSVVLIGLVADMRLRVHLGKISFKLLSFSELAFFKPCVQRCLPICRYFSDSLEHKTGLSRRKLMSESPNV